jgi:F-type H+-transporting ATPase subunit epsilon
MRLKLDIVTPERLIISTEVDEVVVEGVNGEFGILLGHTPFLSLLGIGEVRYREGNTVSRLAVADGFAEAGPEQVTILAERCERPEEIDVGRAQAAQDRAEERIVGDTTEIDFTRAEAALRRALNRVQVAGYRATPVMEHAG